MGKFKTLARVSTSRKMSNLKHPMEEKYNNFDEEEEELLLSMSELERKHKKNKKTLKNSTKEKLRRINHVPSNELIYDSKFASDLLPKLEESKYQFEAMVVLPDNHNCEKLCLYLDNSFESGYGAVGFLNFVWMDICKSGVLLVDSELQRVLSAKIAYGAAFPELVPKDDVSPILVSLDLELREVVFELRGLGENPIQIQLGDIDCAFVACASEQARRMISAAAENYVCRTMSSALSDGNASHSSLAVLGKF
jgi:hypothetical protein